MNTETLQLRQGEPAVLVASHARAATGFIAEVGGMASIVRMAIPIASQSGRGPNSHARPLDRKVATSCVREHPVGGHPGPIGVACRTSGLQTIIGG